MKKFIVLGLDGAIPGIIKEYVNKGKLKNFKRLMEEGVFGENLPFPSAVTPGNWAAIATGAYPGSTGISDFWVHVPGNPFTDENEVFDAVWCDAELLWDAASKEGKRVATINYPCGRPRRSQNHTAIGDNGYPGENTEQNLLAPARLFVTGNLHPVGPYDWKEHEVIRPMRPTGWSGIPGSIELIEEFCIHVEAVNPGTQGKYPFYILVVRADGSYKAVISERKDWGSAVCEIACGHWSEWCEREFILRGTKVQALFRFRPVILQEDTIQLYLSAVYPKTDFTDPVKYGRMLFDKLGPYCDSLNISKLVMGWLDADALMDEFRLQGIWQAKAALELVSNHDHTGVFSKWHGFDKFYHYFFDKIDSASPLFRPEEYAFYESVHGKLLDIADEMLGIVLDGMDGDTSLVVISDHGLMPSCRFAWVNNYLAQKGFIQTYRDEKGTEKIDWQNTKAIMHPFVLLWVNLKGRDPEGCVEPEDYEQVCNELIHALKEWKDETTGEFVMAEVFKRSDGAFYGLWGSKDGDVRFFTTPGYTVYRSNSITEDRCLITDAMGPYTGDHGSQRPSAVLGRGSQTGIFGAAGGEFRKGYSRKVPVKPCDIVPTLCHITGLKPPNHCEGAVLYDILRKEE